MRNRDRRRTNESRHAGPSHDGRALASYKRAVSMKWAHAHGYTRPSIREFREEPFGTICLVADGDECQGLVVIQGLDVVIGVDGPTAAILYQEVTGPPPWGTNPTATADEDGSGLTRRLPERPEAAVSDGRTG